MAQINIAIVNFNTQNLTDALIRSINKFTPNSKIYIFDNSDKTPFINNHSNVTVFDNTKSQLIDFDAWLSNYPNKDKSGGKHNKFASAKHCWTIQYLIDNLEENFILMDSDILLKKDISSLFDEQYLYVGQIIKQWNRLMRVCPFLCFINVKMMKLHNISYFDYKYMHGLADTFRGDRYDTGGAFLMHCNEHPELPRKEIDIDEYMVHFAKGSWSKSNSSIESFLSENKDLY